MPLILGSQSAVATGFTVDNSCQFDDDDSVQLYRAISVGGNRKVWTISMWIKIGNAVGCRLWAQGATPSQNPATMFELGASGAMTIFSYTGSYPFLMEPLAKLKDPNAWYHLVVSFDSTPATPNSSSIKFFINGTQQTQFSSETYPSQDFETEINNTTYDFYVAAYDGGNYFDGYMAEFCLIDGTAYDADSFGQFNEDSPNIWEPIDPSGLTFGTNGFYLDFEDSTALGADAAGSNNLTATNLAAVNQMVDTPTNNFCVMNRMDNEYAGAAFADGNTTVTQTAGDYTWNTASMGLTTGKWYWEGMGPTNISSGIIGISPLFSTGSTTEITTVNDSISCELGTGAVLKGTTSQFTGTSYSSTDVFAIAMDLDNNKWYIAKNNTWVNSGDPESGATGTGAVAITAIASVTQVGKQDAYFPIQSDPSSTLGATLNWNFGNPAYTNTSDAADGNGYGKFEYAPPSGYYAICTKNLAEFG